MRQAGIKALGSKKQWSAQWVVNSHSDPLKVYKVSVTHDGRWACDCPAHRFAKAPKPDCKHIKNVRLSQEIAVSVNLPLPQQVNVGQESYLQVKGNLLKETGKVVARTANTLVIQTRRAICLEED